MPDETKSNLEPIDESGLDLKDKFVGGSAAEAKVESVGLGEEAAPEAKIEEIHSIEGAVERKEGAAEKEAAYSKILSKIGSQTHTPTTDDDVKTDAATVAGGADAESRITNLVNIAEVKGIPHAVKVARHMEDNYTLDEFHDRLLGAELHDALVAKGMIKEI
ncbi:MAG: hypothetical protein P4L62_03130 [Candidatus Pacebacteria bacterium]|nr:hypothetical protein [Candidatus Paceibacterota bacterium]